MLTPPLFTLQRGSAPLLISVPHAGLAVPPEMEDQMTPVGQARADTDLFVDRLAASAPDRGVGVLVAHYSRYVVDLNRHPEGQPLYPGADETGLVPLTSFDHQPLWYRPGGIDFVSRRQRFWAPYHAALDAELTRIRQLHGWAVLLDLHSIPDEVPRFFSGRLPAISLGTSAGTSCAAELSEAVVTALLAGPFEMVRDQRFKGGYITRHYGRPTVGWHALQMELTRSSYLPPDLTWCPERAAAMITTLTHVIDTVLQWRPVPGSTMEGIPASAAR